MSNSDQITYLANVVSISEADGEVTDKEEEVIAFVRQKNGISEDDAKAAVAKAMDADYQITPVGRYSDKIRNLEDMLLASLIDGELSNPEKKAMLAFAKALKLSQEQINIILAETKQFVRQATAEKRCGACGVTLPAGSRFCTECGQEV